MLGAEVSLLGSEFFGDSALDSGLVSLGVSAFGFSSALGVSSAFGASDFGVSEGVGVESEFGVDTGWVVSPVLFVGVLLVGAVGSIVTVGETRSKPPCSSAPTEPTVATVATAAAATTPLFTLKRKAFLRFISFDMYVPQSFY